MKLVMKMDMNLGAIMVKIFKVQFFMVADDVNSYSYKCFLVIRKDSFRGQQFFSGAKICNKSAKICKTTKDIKNYPSKETLTEGGFGIQSGKSM